MKAFSALILIFGALSSIDAAYLPSGWRPDGPAFYLPTETKPPVSSPLEDLILQGQEASASDFLREYGPPKGQNLPEVSTEQAFLVLDVQISEEEKNNEAVEFNVEANTEVSSDLKYEVEESSTTEVSTAVTTEYDIEASFEGNSVSEQNVAKSFNIEVEASVAEDDESELTENLAKEDAEVNEEKTENVAEQKVEETVKNIAEAIENSEKVIVQEVQISQDLAQVKSVEVNSGSSADIPEGFLEYGPPGFKEYGPPKLNNILRTTEEIAEAEKIDSNETRKRRFSPKLRQIQ